MSSHVILVAFEVEATTAAKAEEYLRLHLPRPGARPGLPGPDGPDMSVGLECWWVAEDHRHDGSDLDSAVFVSPGNQDAASRLLWAHGLSPACNLTATQEHGPWEPVLTDLELASRVRVVQAMEADRT